VKLFCAPGTLSLLPHIVFLEAGLAFTAIKIDERTKAIESGGDYRTVNPLGYVPALLLDDGTLLTEGAAIVQYIADQVPSKRLAPPNGTIERAKLQAWLNFFSSEMHKAPMDPSSTRGYRRNRKTCFVTVLERATPTSIGTLRIMSTLWERTSRLRTRTLSRSRTGHLSSTLIFRPTQGCSRIMRASVAVRPFKLR
jgi:Glutathione S-transferase, N-terminal domain